MHDEVTNNTTCFEENIPNWSCDYILLWTRTITVTYRHSCAFWVQMCWIFWPHALQHGPYTKITKKEKQINWLSLPANKEFYFTFNQPRKTNEKAVWLVPVSECLQISTIFDPVLLLTNRPTGSIFFHSLVRLTIFILEHILI